MAFQQRDTVNGVKHHPSSSVQQNCFPKTIKKVVLSFPGFILNAHKFNLPRPSRKIGLQVPDCRDWQPCADMPQEIRHGISTGTVEICSTFSGASLITGSPVKQSPTFMQPALQGAIELHHTWLQPLSHTSHAELAESFGGFHLLVCYQISKLLTTQNAFEMGLYQSSKVS